MKILPKASFKTEDEAKVGTPKTPSCRHPTKVMFLGVVCPLDLLEDSDGKVMIKRVSKITKSNGVSATKSFVPDSITNTNIKDGEWHIFSQNQPICLLAK